MAEQMNISYKKLWKLLIDRDIKKKDFQVSAGISPSSISKLSKDKMYVWIPLLKYAQHPRLNL